MFFSEVFTYVTINACCLVRATMEAQDRRIILGRSDLAFFYASRYEDLIAILRIFRFFTNYLFSMYQAICDFNVRECRMIRFIAAIGIRRLTDQTRTIDDMCVTAIILIMVRAPIIPVMQPRIFGIISMDAFYIGRFARCTLLDRIRNDRFGRIMCAIFGLRAIFTDFL